MRLQELDYSLPELVQLVQDVVAKREEVGPEADLTYEEIAARPLETVQLALRLAVLMQEQMMGGSPEVTQEQIAGMNRYALACHARAQQILEHSPRECLSCGVLLVAPQEWFIGAHPSCYRALNRELSASNDWQTSADEASAKAGLIAAI